MARHRHLGMPAETEPHQRDNAKSRDDAVRLFPRAASPQSHQLHHHRRRGIANGC